ncbi:MAG: right-handed parallel beta-helix repeat-containing protein [Nanoarchaeota archaeon]|nr:right-handed parallel beta-helix repeat-containing protein [Nanoarchaeota archaeon]
MKSIIILLPVIFFLFSSTVSAVSYVNSCQNLDQADETYILTDDITLGSTGICFRIQDEGITFDLGGHTILFDTSPIVNVPNPSFEQGSGSYPSNWDFSNANEGYWDDTGWFYRHGGDHSVVFPSGATPGSYIESDSFTVPAGDYEAYVLFHGFISHPTLDVIGVSGETCSVVELQNGKKYQNYIFCSFSVSSSTSASLRIGISGSPGDDPPVVFDHAEVHPEKVDNAPIKAYTGADGLEIRNGKIIQGDVKSMGGSAIFLDKVGGTRTSSIHDLEITMSGVDTSAILFQTINGLEIYDNKITQTATYTRNRHEMHALIEGHSRNHDMYIHDNELTGGYQSGVRIGSLSSNINVYNNVIDMNTAVTNGFAVHLYRVEGSDVYNNTITGYGEGISIERNGSSQVFNNTIDMIQYKNPEYPLYDASIQGLCARGIKLEVAKDVHVHDNKITTTSDANSYVTCPMNIDSPKDVIVENNEFTSIASVVPSGPDSGFFTNIGVMFQKFDESAGSNLVFRDNIIHSNQAGLQAYEVYGPLKIEDNTFVNTGDTSYKFVFVTGWPALSLSDLTFYNTTNTNTNLDTADAGWSSSDGWNYFVDWPISVNVEDGVGIPIPNAQVTITRDSDSQVMYSGSTGSSGRVIAENIRFFEVVGHTGKTYYVNHEGPYTVEVVYGDTQTRPVAYDTSKDVTFIFGAGVCPDVNSDGAVDIMDLAMVIFAQGRDQNDPYWHAYDHMDVTDDGMVNFDDISRVISYLGYTCS